MDPVLIDAVNNARRPDVRAEVHALYADLARDIDQRRPRCDVSGRCCHFDAYGHRLYITTAELATFLDDFATPAGPAEAPQSARALLPQLTPPSCPLLAGGLCSVHAIRPFGCRIYFCDPTATDWMHATYDRYHARLRDLHDRHHLEYRYVEWRYALQQLGLIVAAGGVGQGL